MRLQILVPQYTKTENVLRPLLDSIAIQQNGSYTRWSVYSARFVGLTDEEISSHYQTFLNQWE